MKKFFNQKAWLYGLSLTIVTSSSISSIFAQDSNTSTDHKVTSIEKTVDKDVQIFVNNPPALNNKEYSAYNWVVKKTTNDSDSEKPQLGVLLKENDSRVIIQKIFPNTTAAEIGLQENDKIFSVDGKIVEDIASFVKIIQNHEVGDFIVINYERDGVSKTAASTLRTTTKNYYLNSRRNYTSNYNYDYNYTRNTSSPKETACEELEKMYGKAFLGVYLSNPYAESGNGAQLTSIIEGTGAKAAVLKAADKITKMDKMPISNSQEAMKFIQSKKPGDKITIQVLRENKTLLIKATLGSWAESPSAASKTRILEAYCDANKLAERDLQANACEKLEALYGKPFLGVYFNAPYAESGNGAQLTSVIEGTAAEIAALKADDKVTKMNQTPISCSKEAMKFIRSKQPGDKINIQVLRDNKNVLIEVILGSWAESPKSASTLSKLTIYCEANKAGEAEEEVAPKENTTDAFMPTFETQAVLEVFPNPTPDFVNIKFEGKKAPLTINIIGLNGQMMYTKNIQNFEGNYSDQLDLSKYPSGVYLIHLTQADQQMTQQVVVE
jgi:S1-C subfamily serine protease